jgi:hypothetical protein
MRLVGQAMALMAEYAVHCGASRGLLQCSADKVDKPLRSRPFQIKAGLQKLVIGQQICGCRWLSNFREEMTGRGWVELDVFVEVKRPITLINATIVKIDVTTPARSVVPVHGGGHPWDELGGLFQHAGPKRPV